MEQTFRSRKRIEVRPHTTKSKKTKSFRKKGECNQDYCKILAGVDKEDKRVRSIMHIDGKKLGDNENIIMDKIKEQLQKEILPPEDLYSEDIRKSQSQPRIETNDLSEKMTMLSQKYNDIKEKEQGNNIMNTNATTIQARYRSYIARKKYQKLKQLAKKPEDQSESNSESEKVVHLSRLNLNDDESKEASKETSKELEKNVDVLEAGVSTEPLKTLEIKEINIGINTEVEENKSVREEKKLEFTTQPVESIGIINAKNKKPLTIEINRDIDIGSNNKPEEITPGSETARSLEESNKKMLLLQAEQEKSEGAPNDSLDQMLEKEIVVSKEAKSIFNRNTFQEFTLKKFGNSLNTDNLSNLLSMRENVISYREKTEKKYIKKLYKSKQLTSLTYQRKRKELEMWVTAQKEEIKQAKIQMLDSWKKTASMIEEAHANSLRIKTFFFKHGLSYNSDTNSTFSQGLDASHPATFDQDLEDSKTGGGDTSQKKQARKLLDRLSEPQSSNESPEIENYNQSLTSKPSKQEQEGANNAILIQDNESAPSTVKRISQESSPPSIEQATSPFDVNTNVGNTNLQEEKGLISIADEEKESKFAETEREKNPESKTINELLPLNIPPQALDTPILPDNPPEDPKAVLADELTAYVYASVVNDIFSNMFPKREPLQREPISPAVNSHLQELLRQATQKKKGIQTDLYQINDYLDELFVEVLTTQKNQFMAEVNQPIIKSPADVLIRLQISEIDQKLQLQQISLQLPHEINPIMQLETYLEVEKKKEVSKQGSSSAQCQGETIHPNHSQSQQLIDECEHIHNKAIFDSVNEALNLIRPYGTHGKPMPWSTLQRILFTKIAEPSIVIRNIKNMVFALVLFN